MKEIKLLTLLAALVCAGSMGAQNVAKVGDTEYASFATAVSNWTDGTTLQLLANVTTSSNISKSSGTLTLDLNGFGIKQTGYNPVFTLTGTAALTISDSNPTATHRFQKGDYDDYATLNESSGNITISGGYITGGRNYGIFVNSGDASLTLNAGTIIGNYNYSTAGAGVNVSNGTFTMNGGSIQYNYSDDGGAGVNMAANTHFHMNGGSIINNIMNSGEGAGVRTESGVEFTMSGSPEVRNNRSDYGDPSNVYVYYGSGNGIDVKIQIQSGFDTGAKNMVGISTSIPGNSDVVVTSNLSSNGSSNYRYFFSDDKCHPLKSSSGDAAISASTGTTTLAIGNSVPSDAVTYDGNAHPMLKGEPATNGGEVKYRYKYRKDKRAWTNYTYSEWQSGIPTGTNAGDYYVQAQVSAREGEPCASGTSTNSAVTFTINRANIEYVAEPQAVTGLVYNGTPRELVTIANNALQIVGSGHPISGSSTMLHYSVACAASNPGCEGQGWAPGQLPNALNPGCYDVTYWVPISDNYNQIGEKHLDNICIEGPSVSETDYDIASYFSSRIGDTMPLKIYRTLLKNGYFNTLCLPFDLSSAQIANSALAGCELFVFAEAEVETDPESGEKQLCQVITPATSIVAGTPYLIRWKTPGATITELNFSSVNIQDAMGDGVNPSQIGGEGVQFVGFVPRIHINYNTDHNYLFLGQENTLVWPETDDSGSMKGFRAYFYIPSGTVINNAPVHHGMPAKLVIRTNAPTGIENVQGDEVQCTKILENGILIFEKNGVRYNAQGQKVK